SLQSRRNCTLLRAQTCRHTAFSPPGASVDRLYSVTSFHRGISGPAARWAAMASGYRTGLAGYPADAFGNLLVFHDPAIIRSVRWGLICQSIQGTCQPPGDLKSGRLW